MSVVALAVGLGSCGTPPPPPRVCGAAPPDSQVPSWQLDGSPFELRVASRFSECAPTPPVRTAEVEVWSERGAPVDATVAVLDTTGDGFSVATILVPGLAPGLCRWSAKFEPSLGVQSGDFYVVEDRPGAAVVDETYVDTMESCWPSQGPVRTVSGATLCTRDSEVWVYRAGQIEGHFTGVHLAVRGDSVWTEVNDRLEHRTDTGATLRFDDGVTMSWGQTGSRGETSATRAVRGSPRGATVVTWDGGALGVTDVDLQPSYEPPGMLAVDDGMLWVVGGLFSPGPCRVERGCQQTTCPPVWECYPEVVSALSLALDEHGTFRHEVRAGSGRVELAWYPRPFVLGSPRATRGAEVLSSASPFWGTQLDTRAPAFQQLDGTVLVARGDGESFVLERYHLRGAELVWADHDFVVAKLGPRKLRFISRR